MPLENEDQELCAELQQWKEVKTTKTHQCEECIKNGTRWVHLRVCQTCGVTLCCDTSENRHATKHFKETGHPIIISAERGEKWAWCYKHEILTEY